MAIYRIGDTVAYDKTGRFKRPEDIKCAVLESIDHARGLVTLGTFRGSVTVSNNFIREWEGE